MFTLIFKVFCVNLTLTVTALRERVTLDFLHLIGRGSLSNQISHEVAVNMQQSIHYFYSYDMNL